MKYLNLFTLLFLSWSFNSYANEPVNVNAVQEVKQDKVVDKNLDPLIEGASVLAVQRGACFVSNSCSGKKLSSSNTCGHCLHKQGKTKGKCWVGNGMRVKQASKCPK